MLALAIDLWLITSQEPGIDGLSDNNHEPGCVIPIGPLKRETEK